MNFEQFEYLTRHVPVCNLSSAKGEKQRRYEMPKQRQRHTESQTHHGRLLPPSFLVIIHGEFLRYDLASQPSHLP
jgi:hypothetical protein